MGFIRTVNLCVWRTEEKYKWDERCSGKISKIIPLKWLINLIFMFIYSIIYQIPFALKIQKKKKKYLHSTSANENWKFEQTPNAEIPQMIVLERIRYLMLWDVSLFHSRQCEPNTYIDVQAGKWKYFNGWYFLGCVSKEFPSAFIPFDGIQCFVFCIMVANKLRHFAALHCTRYRYVQYSQSQW